jgi:hypothetical protein
MPSCAHRQTGRASELAEAAGRCCARERAAAASTPRTGCHALRRPPRASRAGCHRRAAGELGRQGAPHTAQGPRRAPSAMDARWAGSDAPRRAIAGRLRGSPRPRQPSSGRAPEARRPSSRPRAAGTGWGDGRAGADREQATASARAADRAEAVELGGLARAGGGCEGEGRVKVAGRDAEATPGHRRTPWPRAAPRPRTRAGCAGRAAGRAKGRLRRDHGRAHHAGRAADRAGRAHAGHGRWVSRRGRERRGKGRGKGERDGLTSRSDGGVARCRGGGSPVAGRWGKREASGERFARGKEKNARSWEREDEQGATPLRLTGGPHRGAAVAGQLPSACAGGRSGRAIGAAGPRASRTAQVEGGGFRGPHGGKESGWAAGRGRGESWAAGARPPWAEARWATSRPPSEPRTQEGFSFFYFFSVLALIHH